MDGGNSMSSAAAPPQLFSPHRKMMMMHMTFYWGTDALVLFDRWPGRNSPFMYAFCLVFVFVLCALVEGLSRCHLIRPGTNRTVAGIVRTAMHAVRMGLAYMAMLAVMSFNGGIFIAAVAGHAAGFMIFGGAGDQKVPDLPPMRC